MGAGSFNNKNISSIEILLFINVLLEGSLHRDPSSFGVKVIIYLLDVSTYSDMKKVTAVHYFWTSE